MNPYAGLAMRGIVAWKAPKTLNTFPISIGPTNFVIIDLNMFLYMFNISWLSSPAGGADGHTEETNDATDIHKIGHGDGGEANQDELANSSYYS